MLSIGSRVWRRVDRVTLVCLRPMGNGRRVTEL